MAAVRVGEDGWGLTGAWEREESLFAWEVRPARGSSARWAETLRDELMRRRGADAEGGGEDEGRGRLQSRVLGKGDTALPEARLLSQIRAVLVLRGGCPTATLSPPLPGCSAPAETVSSKASSSCNGFCWATAKMRRAPGRARPLPCVLLGHCKLPGQTARSLLGRRCSK